ncbi:hypothetical protein CDAR_618741 [Caerostris darwini]|uniref:Uncharacterized protein n=1 Tax=Caerostris darwini TaxID=1538125 RepID=A0AAV4WRP6_9ARAC|nr:hypothetical protein CDAR_618741 [Caerostris darwini]
MTKEFTTVINSNHHAQFQPRLVSNQERGNVMDSRIKWRHVLQSDNQPVSGMTMGCSDSYCDVHIGLGLQGPWMHLKDWPDGMD